MSPPAARVAAVCAALLLPLALPLALPAQGGAAGSTRVAEGRLMRPDTTGEPKPLPGQWVVLHRVGSDRAAPLDSMRSGGDGTFRFRYRLSGSPEALYFLSSMYRGIAYFSPPLRAAVVRGGDADVLVYDTTTDTSHLRVQGRHFVLSLPREAQREVAEIWEIENPGPRTVVAADTATPLWSAVIPADAANTKVAPGDVAAAAVVFRPGRAELYAPLSPGLRQVALTYSLASKRFPLSVPLERATSVLEVLLEDPKATVSGAGLREVASATIDGRPFRRFLAEDVPRSAVLVVDVPEPPMETTTIFRVLLVTFAALMLGALLFWQARRAPVSAAAPFVQAPAEGTSEALIARLATLDAKFERDQAAGGGSREEYERERAALKSRIASALAAENARR